MNELTENEMTVPAGGAGLDGYQPLYVPLSGSAAIAAILAMLAPSRVVHPAD